MKTKYAIFLAITLSLPAFGQNTPGKTAMTDMKKHDMSSMMGKPTVDATTEGIHLKVWLMTQEKHKKMMDGKMGSNMPGMKHDGMMMHDSSMGMNGMNHDGMGMDQATKEAMMAGTHHIMLVVTDAAHGKEISNAKATLLIVSPSKKNSSVDLMSMMDHYGNGLTLDEKGKYQLKVDVTIDGVSKTKEFTYVVK